MVIEDGKDGVVVQTFIAHVGRKFAVAEAVQPAAARAKPQCSVGLSVYGPHDLAGQAVACRVRSEVAIFKAIEASVSTEPKRLILIFEDSSHIIVRQTVPRSIGDES